MCLRSTALCYTNAPGTQTKEWRLPSWVHALACQEPTCLYPPINSPISECHCSTFHWSLLLLRDEQWLCLMNLILCSSPQRHCVCASPEIFWQRRTRKECLMLITSLCGTRERQSRSPAHLSTPFPSAQVCRTKLEIRNSSSSMQQVHLSLHKTTLVYCCWIICTVHYTGLSQ